MGRVHLGRRLGLVSGMFGEDGPQFGDLGFSEGFVLQKGGDERRKAAPEEPVHEAAAFLKNAGSTRGQWEIPVFPALFFHAEGLLGGETSQHGIDSGQSPVVLTGEFGLDGGGGLRGRGPNDFHHLPLGWADLRRRRQG